MLILLLCVAQTTVSLSPVMPRRIYEKAAESNRATRRGPRMALGRATAARSGGAGPRRCTRSAPRRPSGAQESILSRADLTFSDDLTQAARVRGASARCHVPQVRRARPGRRAQEDGPRPSRGPGVLGLRQRCPLRPLRLDLAPAARLAARATRDATRRRGGRRGSRRVVEEGASAAGRRRGAAVAPRLSFLERGGAAGRGRAGDAERDSYEADVSRRGGLFGRPPLARGRRF
ncbi:hypothetical protein M885DRAFT_79373 [Pelagophyceae sp. CCMP2097]|nr:hypothetical protein M885DRAFT_79373 [Pelagophyceae sp. CCMP2097]